MVTLLLSPYLPGWNTFVEIPKQNKKCSTDTSLCDLLQCYSHWCFLSFFFVTVRLVMLLNASPKSRTLRLFFAKWVKYSLKCRMLMLPLSRLRHVIHISYEMNYLNKMTIICSCCLDIINCTQLRLPRIWMNFYILKDCTSLK